MFCFIHYWKNKLRLDWVHISADRQTYLMSLIASLVFKANSIFEVYFYIMLIFCYDFLYKNLNFILHFFQKLTHVTTSVLGCCAFSNLRTAMKLFIVVLQIKEAKIIVVEDSGQKCVSNKGICISRPPAFCLSPDTGPRFVFTGPGPQFVFNSPSPEYVLTCPSSKFVFSGPGPKFVFTGPGL